MHVPLARHLMRDGQVEGAATGAGHAIGAHAQLLQLAGARVRRAAQNERQPVGAFEERRQRLVAEIGMQCDGIGAEGVEGGAGVGTAGAADVAALGIQDHRHLGVARVDVGDGAHERAHPRRAIRFVERAVRLEGTDEVCGRVDDGLVEGDQRAFDLRAPAIVRQREHRRVVAPYRRRQAGEGADGPHYRATGAGPVAGLALVYMPRVEAEGAVVAVVAAAGQRANEALAVPTLEALLRRVAAPTKRLAARRLFAWRAAAARAALLPAGAAYRGRHVVGPTLSPRLRWRGGAAILTLTLTPMLAPALVARCHGTP